MPNAFITAIILVGEEDGIDLLYDVARDFDHGFLFRGNQCSTGSAFHADLGRLTLHQGRQCRGDTCQSRRPNAERNNGEIVRLFRIAETVSKHDERKTFKELMAFAKKNGNKLDGLIFCEVDMRRKYKLTWQPRAGGPVAKKAQGQERLLCRWTRQDRSQSLQSGVKRV